MLALLLAVAAIVAMPRPGPAPTWRCSNCGAENDFDTAVCRRCGRF